MSSSPFRLLIVGLRWPPETFIYQRLKALAGDGIDVAVAATVQDDCIEDMPSGIRLLSMPSWDGPTWKRTLALLRQGGMALKRSPTALRRVVTAVKDQGRGVRDALRLLNRLIPLAGVKSDIVHFEWNSAAIDYFPLFDLIRSPVVISCRGRHVNVVPHVPDQQSFVHGLRKTFYRASAVHCVSEAVLREATKYGLDPCKATIIRPAVDPELFQPAGRSRVSSSAGLKLISTGSLIWRKGFEDALLAVRRLIDAGIDLQFEVVGDGPERQRLLYTVYDLSLQKHVHLLGRLQPCQVRDALQRADVFLLSSVSEGISNAVLEAMACGLAVVTTDSGGMREAVTDGIEGFVVPVRDPEAMAQALQRLARNKGMREQMAQSARQRILREFTLDQQKKQFVELYTSLLRREGGALDEDCLGRSRLPQNIGNFYC